MGCIKSKVNKDFLNELDIDNNINQNKNESEIKIIYDINNKDEEYEEEEEIINIFEEKEDEQIINIFGAEFVENNKNICKMIIDDKEYEISEKYNIGNFNNDILEIKLKGIENVTNMSYMFDGCSSLSSLPDISKWNTNNITDMSGMFNGCSKLKYSNEIKNKFKL